MNFRPAAAARLRLPEDGFLDRRRVPSSDVDLIILREFAGYAHPHRPDGTR